MFNYINFFKVKIIIVYLLILKKCFVLFCSLWFQELRYKAMVSSLEDHQDLKTTVTWITFLFYSEAFFWMSFRFIFIIASYIYNPLFCFISFYSSFFSDTRKGHEVKVCNTTFFRNREYGFYFFFNFWHFIDFSNEKLICQNFFELLFATINLTNLWKECLTSC